MKSLKSVHAIVRVIFVLACFPMFALAQSDDKKLASVSGGPSLKFGVSIANSGLTVTVSGPDGQVFRKDYKGGSAIEFNLVDKKGEKLADGQYSYELRVAPVISAETKEALKDARKKGNDEDVARDFVKRGVLLAKPLTQSAGFLIVNGSAVVADDSDQPTSRRIAIREAAATFPTCQYLWRCRDDWSPTPPRGR